MPAKGKYHDSVIAALKKDGWTFVSDQITLLIGERRLWVDSRVRNEEQNIILIEVKRYNTVNSPISFLQQALGQYLMYRAILDKENHSEPLYLAIPEQADIEIMQTEIGQLMIDRYNLNLIVYEMSKAR